MCLTDYISYTVFFFAGLVLTTGFIVV